MVGLISVFVVMKFDCTLCYDKHQRNYENNPYIFALLIMSAAGSIISFLIYLGLTYFEIITAHKRAAEVDFVWKDKLTEKEAKGVAVDPKLMRLYSWKMKEEDVDESADDVERTEMLEIDHDDEE